MSDFPFDDVVKSATRLIDRGDTVFQKFSCSTCGQRLPMEEPNMFFRTGTCDKCGNETQIDAQGCNYVLVMSSEKED